MKYRINYHHQNYLFVKINNILNDVIVSKYYINKQKQKHIQIFYVKTHSNHLRNSGTTFSLCK